MKNTVFYTHLSFKKFIKKLSPFFTIHLIRTDYQIKTLYDSFDWRLYQNRLYAEFIQSNSLSEFSILSTENADSISKIATRHPPVILEYKQSPVNALLGPLLGDRALLPIASIDYEHHLLELLDSSGNALATLRFDQYDLFDNRIMIEINQDGTSMAKKIKKVLVNELKLSHDSQSEYDNLLKAHARKPLDYPPQFPENPDPSQTSLLACQAIFQVLLKIIKTNEHSIMDQLDSEFLHDYRVAIRKTLSLLKHFPGILGDADRKHFNEVFSAILKTTNDVRDLDIQLASLDQYTGLPESETSLASLRLQLEQKRANNHQKLVTLITSIEYKTDLYRWERFILGPNLSERKEANASLGIKKAATKELKKLQAKWLEQLHLYQSIESSLAPHKLRKTNKELRYLLDFFSHFYHKKQTKVFLKSLKDIQDALGHHQDIRTQQAQLKSLQHTFRKSEDQAKVVDFIKKVLQLMKKEEASSVKRLHSMIDRYMAIFSEPIV